jgi:hypothetical protein
VEIVRILVEWAIAAPGALALRPGWLEARTQAS